MSKKQYWKDHFFFLLINTICMIALSLFLLVTGNSMDSIFLILGIWLFLLTMGLYVSYQKEKKQLDKLLKITDTLEERYLLAEMLPKPEHAKDQVYSLLLKLACKSMLEQIGTVKRERQEYKEYIEQWIHEIKTPITAMKLLCENNRSPLTRDLLVELEKTNRFTEQALYYARIEHTEKDYSIQKLPFIRMKNGFVSF